MLTWSKQYRDASRIPAVHILSFGWQHCFKTVCDALQRKVFATKSPALNTHTFNSEHSECVCRTAAWGLWSEFWQIGGTVGLWGKTAGWHRACLIQSPHSISVTDNCFYRGAASSLDPNHPSRSSYHTNTRVCHLTGASLVSCVYQTLVLNYKNLPLAAVSCLSLPVLRRQIYCSRYAGH